MQSSIYIPCMKSALVYDAEAWHEDMSIHYKMDKQHVLLWEMATQLKHVYT